MKGSSWLAWLTLLLLAWGVLAFGAVYPWTYVPLLAGCALVAVAALATDRQQGLPEHDLPLALAWLLVVAAAAAQLVPMPPRLLALLSPATPRFLEQYDLGYLARALPEGLDAAVAASAPPAAGAWHALSIRPASTAVGLVFLVVLGLLLLGLSRVFSRGGLRPVVRGILVLAAVVAFIGIVQRSILGDHAYGGMKIYGIWQPRNLLVTPFGPFVNKNHFAGWMLMALPLALGYMCTLLERARDIRPVNTRDRILWFSTPEGGQSLLVGLTIIVMGVSLLMTRSRSGFIGLAVAMVLAGGLAVRAFRRTPARLAVAAVFAVLFVAPVAWLGADFALGRFSMAGGGSAIQLRLDTWQSALRIAADFPLAGSGLNTFGVATLLYQVGSPDLHFAQAHNDYLQLAAEGGLLLGLPALLFIATLVRSIARRVQAGQDDPATRWLRAGAIIGLIAIAVQSLVEFSLQMPGNAVLFVVLAAAAMHRPPVADLVPALRPYRVSTDSPPTSTTIH